MAKCVSYSTMETEGFTVTQVAGRHQVWKDQAVFDYLSQPRQDSGLMLVLCRKVRFTLPSGVVLTAHRNDTVYLPAGSHYAVKFHLDASDEAPTTVLINFTLRHGEEDTVLSDSPMLLDRDADGTRRKRFFSLVQDYYAAKTVPLHAHLMLLIDDLFGRKPPALGAAESIAAYVNRALTHIKSIGDVAAHFRVSESTLRRMFQKEVGVSPVEYILRQKILRARQMLLQAEMSVETICYELNFYDPPHFVHVFKKYTGMTPKTYIDTHSPQDTSWI